MERATALSASLTAISTYFSISRREQAIEFYNNLTGGAMTQDYNQDKDLYHSWEDFVDGYVKEEPLDKVFTYYGYQNTGEDIKKTIQEFLDDVEEVPSYFACSEY